MAQPEICRFVSRNGTAFATAKAEPGSREPDQDRKVLAARKLLDASLTRLPVGSGCQRWNESNVCASESGRLYFVIDGKGHAVSDGRFPTVMRPGQHSNGRKFWAAVA